jgi:hypothetical protein
MNYFYIFSNCQYFLDSFTKLVVILVFVILFFMAYLFYMLIFQLADGCCDYIGLLCLFLFPF